METKYFDLAKEIIAAIEVGFEAAEIDLPERRGVSAGDAVWDTAQVSVWWETSIPSGGDPNLALPTSLNAAGHGIRSSLYRVLIVRCAPAFSTEDGSLVAEIPSVEEMEEIALTQMVDVYMMQKVLLDAESDGRLTCCNSLSFGNCVGLGPAGNLVGVMLDLNIRMS